MRLFHKRKRADDGASTPMQMMKAAWSPEDQIRDLRVGMAQLREQVARLEQIITAAGIATRQQAGWLVSPETSKERLLPDAPSESYGMLGGTPPGRRG
jgi:hypothetical protein